MATVGIKGLMAHQHH